MLRLSNCVVAVFGITAAVNPLHATPVSTRPEGSAAALLIAGAVLIGIGCIRRSKRTTSAPETETKSNT